MEFSAIDTLLRLYNERNFILWMQCGNICFVIITEPFKTAIGNWLIR